MKSAAIVLGLALAVNAQVDNELATSFPSHPSGADLVRNAGWGRSQPIHVPPKHTNPTYWSKNDDAADYEFVQTFYSPSGADLVKYAKQSQQTVYRPTAHVVRDDEGDDELMVYYTKDSQGNKHYQGGYTVRRDDEVDDELMVYYTKDSQGNKHYQGGYTVRRDDAADDELAAFPSHPSGADLVRNAGWGRSQPIHTPPKHTNPTYWSKNDDVADDELVQTFYSPSGADLVKYAKQSQQTVYRPTAHVVRDDADDELVSLSGADLVKYAKQSQQTVYRPTAHVVRDDEGDDELMVYYTKDSQGNKHYQGGYTVRRDDAADDELAAFPSHPSGADLVRNAGWGRSQPIHTPPKHTNPTYWSKNDDVADDELVQTFYSPSGADLVKYAKQSQQTVYRPTAHVVRDDEGDDELMVYYTKDSQGNKHYQGGYTVRRDDEADDELVSLGHLIREAEQVDKKPDVRKYFRHL